MESSFHLTFDLDWAPEYALKEFREMLESASVPATVFFTHVSEETRRLQALPFVETALHPNFLRADSEEKQLETLLKDFPKSRGVRTHSLYYHSGLLKTYHRAGIEYLSHDIFFLQNEIRPFFDWSGLVRMPIFWEDDVHASYFAGDFENTEILKDKKGLRILNFHPIHLFLNTGRFEDYQKAKPDLGDEKKARKHQKAGKGVRTFFEAALKSVKPGEWLTMAQGCSRFKATQKYQGKYSPEGRS